MRYALIALVGLTACEATFHEVDVEQSGSGGGPIVFPDAGGLPDAAVSAETIVSQGDWQNAGYPVQGSVAIVRLQSGVYEIQLSDDFIGADLPGPTLFLSNRASIGRSGIRPQEGDVPIADLDDVTGPLSFPVPESGIDRQFAWIYCRPFAAEMHVARLDAP